MKSLTKILRQKKLSKKEDIAKFLVGKNVKITAKRNEHNYGKIGDTFTIDKVDNLCWDNDPHAQLKDYKNRIFLTDLELCPKKYRTKTERVMRLIHDNGVTSMEHLGLLQNIFHP